jgi:hypothetical protein
MSHGDDDLFHDDEDGAEAAEQGTVDAASPIARREITRRQKREREDSLQFWRTCLNTAVGRRELWRNVVAAGRVFEAGFACGPNGFPQSEATWFQAGESTFARRLYLAWLRDHRDLVGLMHDENDPHFTAKPRGRRPRKDVTDG